MSAEMTLHESAAILNVHYMTVYRYVRLGLLPAYKQRGVWRVDAQDLERFQHSNHGATLTLTAPDHHAGRRRAPWADRLAARLAAGDGQGAWGVIEASLASGTALESVYIDQLMPALTMIQQRCVHGELDVSIEHRARMLVTRLVGRLGPRFARRGRNRGGVLVGSPVIETHTFATMMAADVLRHRGWEVSDLGADVPASGFVYMIGHNDSVVSVVLLAGRADSLDVFAETAAVIRDAVPGMLIVASGESLAGGDAAAVLGVDEVAADVRETAEILDRHFGDLATTS